MTTEVAPTRVRISPLRRADGLALIAAHRASCDLHHPWVSPCLEEEEFERWRIEAVTGPHLRLVARLAADDAIVGVVSLSQIAFGPLRSAYLAFWGMAGQTGRGLMTEALDGAVRHAFDEIGLHRVEANIQPDNERSVALVRRARFTREGFSPRYLHLGGTWRDHERWTRLAA